MSFHDGFVVAGLDCEMVGGGAEGEISMLARCSLVTLDRVPMGNRVAKAKAPASDSDSEATDTTASSSDDDSEAIDPAYEPGRGVADIGEGLVILYDKYVVPRGRITDYRTEWSGITSHTYERGGDSPIPIVSYERCREEITRLLSSADGKGVVVVGHGLENDFGALGIEHPPWLTRDTAFYPPYMRWSSEWLYPEKLSYLTSRELGVEIQRRGSWTDVAADGHPAEDAVPAAGHSSVEDAAAALRLYWHKFHEWEGSLGYPLVHSRHAACRAPALAQPWSPLTMYLDERNLPVGVRGVDLKKLLKNYRPNDPDRNVITSKNFRLTSRKRGGRRASDMLTVDWIPIFRTALSSGPSIGEISVMFDGVKFGKAKGKRRIVKEPDCLETRVFRLMEPSSEGQGSMKIEITTTRDSSDDVLVHRCRPLHEEGGATYPLGTTISLREAADILSSCEADDVADALPGYIVVRRRPGGTMAHRKLFERLRLRGPDDRGALCLSALTPGLRADAAKTVKELLGERGVEGAIECELRRREDLKHVVVTNDALLADLLVSNGVLALSFRQLRKMF